MILLIYYILLSQTIMASHLHLLRVTVRPNAYYDEVLKGITGAVHGTTTPTRVLYSFKVDGENQLLFVVNGSADPLLKKVVTSYGGDVETICVPLRSYRNFATNVLGVEEVGKEPAWIPDGKLYWVEFNIEYLGLDSKRLLEIWKQEAEAALQLVSAGKLLLFKTVALRQVHAFISIENNDLMDDVLFTLPIIKLLGNQVKLQARSILLLKK